MRPVLKQVAELIGGAIRDLKQVLEPKVKSLEDKQALLFKELGAVQDELKEAIANIKAFHDQMLAPLTIEGIVRAMTKEHSDAVDACLKTLEETSNLNVGTHKAALDDLDNGLDELWNAIKKLEDVQQSPATLENIVRQVVADLREADKALVERCAEAAAPKAQELSDKIDSVREALEHNVKSSLECEAALRAELQELRAAPSPAIPSASEIAALVPVPKDGTSFTMEQVKELVAQAMALVALPTADDVAVSLASSHLPQWELDFERRAQDLMLRSIDRIPVPKDGQDGLGFEDMEVAYDGLRTFTHVYTRGERRKTMSFKVPMMIYHGIFVEGKAYDKGDVATWGGSAWIALKDAPQGKPGNSHDWQLIVKKGRDGSSK